MHPGNPYFVDQFTLNYLFAILVEEAQTLDANIKTPKVKLPWMETLVAIAYKLHFGSLDYNTLREERKTLYRAFAEGLKGNLKAVDSYILMMELASE